METENNTEKPGIWTLIIGILLCLRGTTRLMNNEGGALNILAIIMLVVGLGSIIYYISKSV